jgi:hypothetical protein
MKEEFDESKFQRSEVGCAHDRGDSGNRGTWLAVRATTQKYDRRLAAKIWARV